MPRTTYIAFKVDNPEVAGKIYNYAIEQGVDGLLTTDQNLVTKWRETRRTGQPRPDRALQDSQPSIEHGSGDEAGPSLPKKTVPQEDKPLPSINQQMGAQLPPVKASADEAMEGIVADSGPQRQLDIQPKCSREDSINQLPSIADGEMGGVTIFHVDESLAARDVIRRESDDQTQGPTGDDKPFFVPKALQDPRSSEITPEAVVVAKPFAAVIHVDAPLAVRDVIMGEPDDQRQGPTGDDKPFTVSKVILQQREPPAEAVEAVDDVNMEDSVEESQGPSGNTTPAVSQKRRGRPPGKKNNTAGAARRSLSAPDVDEAGELGPSGGETPAVEAKKRGRKRKPPVEKLPANLLPYDVIIDTEPHRRSVRHLAVTLDRGEPVEQPQQKRKTPVKAKAPPKKRATARRQEEEESQNEDEPEEEENVGWREWGERREDRPLFQEAHGSMDHAPSGDVKPSVQVLQDPVLLRCFNEMVLNTPNKPGSVRVKEEPVDASTHIVRVKEEPMDEEQSIAHDVLDNIVSLILNDAASETIRVKKELIEDYGEQATAENMTCPSIGFPDNLRIKKETGEYPAKDTTQNPPEVITLAGGPAAIVLPPENRAAVAADLSGIPHPEGHGAKVEQVPLPKTGNQPMEQALPGPSAAQIVTDVTSGIGDVTQPQRALPVIEGPAANMEDIVLPPFVTHDNIRKKATTFHKSSEKPSSSACESPYAKARVIMAAARKSSPYKPILPISPVRRQGFPHLQQRQAQPVSPLSAASTSKNIGDVISGNAVPSVSGPAANLEDIVLPPTPAPVTHSKPSSSKHEMGSPYALHRTIRAKNSKSSPLSRHGYPHPGQRQAQPVSPLSVASTSKKAGGAISGNAAPSVVGPAANLEDIVLPPTPAPQLKVLRNRSVGWTCRHSCGIFNTKGDLMTHMESHSTTPVKAPSLPSTTPVSTKKEFVCTVCGKVCTTKSGLTNHGKTHRK